MIKITDEIKNDENNFIKTNEKCRGINNDNKPCEYEILNNKGFCHSHEHMNDYTEEMMNKLEYCSGCLKMKYKNNDSCNDCLEKATAYNTKKKIERNLQPRCNADDCKYKALKNGYCGNHKKQALTNSKDTSIESPNIHQEIKYTVCNKSLNPEIYTEAQPTCIECKINDGTIYGKPNNNEYYNSLENDVDKIKKIQDSKNNKKKIVIYNIAPEKCTKTKMKECIATSKTRKIDFKLSYDECDKLFNNNCYYCGYVCQNGELNGIDRKKNDRCYEINNCVSCCKICNIIKHSLDDKTFLERCEHILTYLKLFKGFLYYDTFLNYKSRGYKYYENSAKRREIEFELTKEDVDQLKSNECYLCGRKTNKDHINGIDRFNNNMGYIKGNCRTCCADCNYMKREYEYDMLINKLQDIIKYHNILEKTDNDKIKFNSEKYMKNRREDIKMRNIKKWLKNI